MPTPEDDSDDSAAQEEEERSQKRRKKAKFDAELRRYNLPGSTRDRRSSKSDRSGNNENLRSSNSNQKNLKMTKTRGQLAGEKRGDKAAERKARQRHAEEEEEEYAPKNDDDLSTNSTTSDPPQVTNILTRGGNKAPRSTKKRAGRPKNDLDEEKHEVEDDESGTEGESGAEVSQNPTNNIVEVSSPETQREEQAHLNDQDAQATDGKAGKKAKLQADRIAKLEQQWAMAKAPSKAAKKPSGRKVKPSEMTPEERQWKAQVKQAVLAGSWHINKFCNGPERLELITRKVMKFMKLEIFKGLTGKELKKQEAIWVVANRDLVRSSLNTIRNDIAGQIRKEYVDRTSKQVRDKDLEWKPDWHHAKLTPKHLRAIKANLGKEKDEWEAVPTITNIRQSFELCVPTLQDIQDCIEREPHLMTTAKGRALFDDFVDRWLLRCAGKPNWDTDKRHHQTVSLAARDVDGEPCIDPGMEAMLFMFFENQHHRHAGLAIAKMGGAEFTNKKGKSSPWTCSDGGQMSYGGRTKAGQERWKIMRGKVTNSRQRTHAKKMEAECLARLRQKYGLDGGGRAAKAPAAPKRPMCAPAEDSDNDFLV